MPRRKQVTTETTSKRPRPALTPEARENQLISLAVDLVEQRLIDGTASSQETTHFLKLASTKTKYEIEKLKSENELLRAKKQSIESNDRAEERYKEAIEAMRLYSGNGGSNDY